MKRIRLFIFSVFFSAGFCLADDPTFGDLAVVMAKGYFRNQVPQNAGLSECVAFLNRHGVSFSIFDLVDPDKKVTREDVARAVGQSALLFSGDADVVRGRIKKPLEAETWVDYCILNDIDFTPIWELLCKSTEKESLPEVRAFFRR